MIEPPRSRNSTPPKPAPRSSRRAPRRPGSARPRRAGTGRRPRPAASRPSRGDDAVEPEREERPQRPARARDLEDREPAARTQHAPELGQGALEVGDVADTEADRGGVERPRLERQGEQVSLDPAQRGCLPAGALEHPRREVEAGHGHRPGPPVGEGEVAGAAGRVEDVVAGANGRGRGEPPPAQVEPRGHDAVHRVVDRRDAVEHRADGVRRQRHCRPSPPLLRLGLPAWTSIPTAYAQARRARRLLRSLRGVEEGCELGEVLDPLAGEARHRASLVHARGALQVRDLEGDPLVLRPFGREVGRTEVVVALTEVGVAVEAADRGEEPCASDRDRVVLEALLLRPARDELDQLRAERLLGDRRRGR